MAKLENEQITIILDLVKDELSGLARLVYNAIDDGKIQWYEALPIATAAASAGTSIMQAFQVLDSATIKQLLDALADSDLVLEKS